MLSFPCSSVGKESACNAGDPTSIPGLGRSPGEANGNPLQYGEAHGQRSLVGYSPWGHKESDTTEQLRFLSFDIILQASRSKETSLVVQVVKHLPTVRETQVRPLGREDPLEKQMATHSSTLAWRIPWREEPGPWGCKELDVTSLSLG